MIDRSSKLGKRGVERIIFISEKFHTKGSTFIDSVAWSFNICANISDIAGIIANFYIGKRILMK